MCFLGILPNYPRLRSTLFIYRRATPGIRASGYFRICFSQKIILTNHVLFLTLLPHLTINHRCTYGLMKNKWKLWFYVVVDAPVGLGHPGERARQNHSQSSLAQDTCLVTVLLDQKDDDSPDRFTYDYIMWMPCFKTVVYHSSAWSIAWNRTSPCGCFPVIPCWSIINYMEE